MIFTGALFDAGQREGGGAGVFRGVLEEFLRHKSGFYLDERDLEVPGERGGLRIRGKAIAAFKLAQERGIHVRRGGGFPQGHAFAEAQFPEHLAEGAGCQWPACRVAA